MEDLHQQNQWSGLQTIVMVIRTRHLAIADNQGLIYSKEIIKPRRIAADQLRFLFLDFSRSVVLLGISANIVVLLFDGNFKKTTLMPSCFWLLFTSGLANY